MKRQSLGERIRVARLAKGWTQDQLANQSQVSVRTVREVEANKRKPQQAKRISMFRALDLDGDADDTRSEWSDDVQVYLDVVGQALERMTVAERRETLVRIIGTIRGTGQ